MLKNALQKSHHLLTNIVKPGDTVVDATMGNGHDTLFLSQLVGTKGHVYSFDIQSQALTSTAQLLAKNDATESVNLIQDSHANLKKYVNTNITGMTFNLGYLPGGDKKIITNANSTVSSIEDGLDLLQVGGIITLVCYYGHPGGQVEFDAVTKFTSELDQKKYNVLRYEFINQAHQPPVLIAIEKK